MNNSFSSNKASNLLETNKKLPKIIWTAWFQGLDNAPALVKYCYESWISQNPDWKVILITNENQKDYFDLESVVGENRLDISIQKQANLLRLNLLAQYGGIWTDPTCFCNAPLDEWIYEYTQSGFFVFQPFAKDRVLSNWFIASREGCHLTKAFCKEHNCFWADNIFSNQNTKIGKYLVKNLSKILRKEENDTDFWLSYLTRKILKIYPYRIFHYHFASHLKNDSISNDIFQRVKYASSDNSCQVTKLSRQKENIHKIHEVASKVYPPVHKLNWKQDIFKREGINELDYLSLVLPKISK